jgi:Transposase DDE domain
MDGYTRQTLERLPLAEAVLRLWQHALSGEVLGAIYDEHRGRSYEGVLSFESLVRLVADALLEPDGSGRQAFQRADEAGELPTSQEAVYGKLRRLPISLSNGFLFAGTRRLEEVVPAVGSPLPESLREFEGLIIDGKKLKHLPKRMKVARGVKGAVLGGKAVAALSWETGLAVAINGHLDGETSDAPLMPGLLEQLDARRRPGTRQSRVPAGCPPRLFIEDRQFCDLVQPWLCLRHEGDHFLIRYNAKVKFYRDEKRRLVRGVDSRGRRYVQEWGWLGGPTDKRRLYVRRLTLYRQGEENIILVTDLVDDEKYPAADLLKAYRARWGIERVFQRITEVFHLNTLISTSPQGTLFQFAFCLLLYNLLEIIRNYLAAQQKLAVEKISLEQLFYDVQRQLNRLERTDRTGGHRNRPPTVSRSASTSATPESDPRAHLDRPLAHSSSQETRPPAQVPRFPHPPRRSHLAPPTPASLDSTLTASHNHVHSTGFLTCRDCRRARGGHR